MSKEQRKSDSPLSPEKEKPEKRRCRDTQQQISSLLHVRKTVMESRKTTLSSGNTCCAGVEERREESSNRSPERSSGSDAEGCFGLPLGRRLQCHGLSRKRTPTPAALLQEAFEILSRGKHQGFAVDAARAVVSENAASHATACPPQTAVRSTLSASFVPYGRQGSARMLSRDPDSWQKRNGECADHACWWYTRLSLDSGCRFRQLHGIPPPVFALLGKKASGIVLADSYSGHGWDHRCASASP